MITLMIGPQMRLMYWLNYPEWSPDHRTVFIGRGIGCKLFGVYGKIAFQIVSRETGRWGWKAREGIVEILTAICIAGGLSEAKGEMGGYFPWKYS